MLPLVLLEPCKHGFTRERNRTRSAHPMQPPVSVSLPLPFIFRSNLPKRFFDRRLASLECFGRERQLSPSYREIIDESLFPARVNRSLVLFSGSCASIDLASPSSLSRKARKLAEVRASGAERSDLSIRFPRTSRRSRVRARSSLPAVIYARP